MGQDSIPIFSGNHYEMGIQQGINFKENIREGIQIISSLPEFSSQRPWFLPKKIFWKIAKKKAFDWLNPYFKKYASNQAERVKGIAKGSEIDESWIYLLMSTELVLDTPDYIMPLDSCTGIGVNKARSDGNSSIIARNFDYSRFVLPFLQVRHLQPTGDYFSSFDITASPLAGTFNGMNEYGLFIGTNEMSTTLPRQNGLPSSILIQEALERSTTTEEAINFLKSSPRGSTNAWVLGDANDDIRAVEFIYDKVLTRSPKDFSGKGWLVETNHFLQHEFQKLEIPLDALFGPSRPNRFQGMAVGKSTLTRYNSATQLLLDLGDQKISPEMLKTILSDHSTDPTQRYACLCRHDLDTISAASMIALPQEKSLLYCFGNPCEHEYQKFQFL